MSEFRKVTNDEEQLLNSISKLGLMEFNENIAREVRLSGSEEELRAFEYANEQLAKMGLNAQLMFHDAYISLPQEASLSVMGVGYKCITHSMGASVSELTAEVVYLDKQALRNRNTQSVSGKVFLLDGLATPHMVKMAAESGAAGVIFIQDLYTHEMIVSPIWGHPVPETVHHLPKIPVLSVTKTDGKKIKETVLDGNAHCVITAVVDTQFRSIPTLIAEIPGCENPDQFVLFGGHIDSWHYGAMDNGSADALILEVSRVLAQHRNKLKRTLRIAFWSGHSHGRYAGSSWYCDTHWEQLEENCVTYVTVDSVGAKGSDILTQASCMAETRGIAWDAVGAITGQRFEGERIGRAGDQSFWGPGVPSLFSDLSLQPPFSEEQPAASFNELLGGGKTGSFGWWWHTTEDTLDKIDPDLLVRDTKVYLLALYRLLTDPVIPLDQYEAASDILQGLTGWQNKAETHFDLSEAIRRASLLKEKLLVLKTREEEVYTALNEIKILNNMKTKLSRCLVPMNYVKGSRFDHDLALAQPQLPKLSVIDQLLLEEKGCDRYRFLYTSLQRNYNEIKYSLQQALHLCDDALESLARFND